MLQILNKLLALGLFSYICPLNKVTESTTNNEKSICFPMHGKRIDGLVFLCINQKCRYSFFHQR